MTDNSIISGNSRSSPKTGKFPRRLCARGRTMNHPRWVLCRFLFGQSLPGCLPVRRPCFHGAYSGVQSLPPTDQHHGAARTSASSSWTITASFAPERRDAGFPRRKKSLLPGALVHENYASRAKGSRQKMNKCQEFSDYSLEFSVNSSKRSSDNICLNNYARFRMETICAVITQVFINSNVNKLGR